ncbi:hypothetical protein [Zavarzinia compransoris]|uniref:GNAT family N-acetyltransferase n=1 Tax=Zavarzinia compransoris TaxID=1264899 RepID=A0A317E8J0_9PROT|nr:hypothetical protein [Zavarzinia compransoris]PWR23478.1 hypothetical protein DKG75_02595 [Zavarzinia compransoris]TDP45941.1 hypothetical protein DES42_10422 [Zavarzinia compransoris]
MSAPYHVSTLQAARVDAAFPLANACLGATDLASWRGTASRFSGRADRGLIAAEREGYITGLLAYAVLPTPAGGREMVVHALGVLELLFPEHAGLALVEAARTIARDLDCADVVLALPERSVPWAAALFSGGDWHDAGRLAVAPGR